VLNNIYNEDHIAFTSENKRRMKKEDKMNWMKIKLLTVVILAFLAQCDANQADDKKELDKFRSEAIKDDTIQNNIVEDKLSNFGKTPELIGIMNWINSSPLSLKMLQGKVVLINFWTYSCINCIRTLPYIEKWYKDYKKEGFVVIGVHTPEFEFEKNPKNVAEAAVRLGVTYPVAQDNEYKTWKAFKNIYWPAYYLIDRNGNLRLVHYGEGKYMETENTIRELLNMPE
jgi:thiol-disulfide isomerase/thioredoxin